MGTTYEEEFKDPVLHFDHWICVCTGLARNAARVARPQGKRGVSRVSADEAYARAHAGSLYAPQQRGF